MFRSDPPSRVPPLPVLLLIVCVLSLIVLPAKGQTSQAAADLLRWRKAYADDLNKPDGWLSLVALQWLQDGDTSVGSTPDNKLQLPHVPAHLGVFRQHNGRVEFFAPPEGLSSSVLLDGKPAAGGFLNIDDSPHPSQITANSVLITVIHRGDRFYLRVKDAYAPTRLHFRGLKWYAPDPGLRITAKWVPFPTPQTLHIVNVLGQITDEPSPGYAEFQLEGKTVRLEPTVEGNTLFFDLRDTTSRSTTDGAGRFLNTDLPSNGVAAPGKVVLDFNYAHNPPCGYTPFATCPLPPPQNKLNIALPAGEKRYADE